MTFFEGDLDYVVEDTDRGAEIGEWMRSRAWCGQTAFTFPVEPDHLSEPQAAAGQDSSCSAAGDLPGRMSESEWCRVASEEAFEGGRASKADPCHYEEDMMFTMGERKEFRLGSTSASSAAPKRLWRRVDVAIHL